MQDAIDRSFATTLDDRRRPGRPETVRAALLPLLRAEEREKLLALPPETFEDTGTCADERFEFIGERRLLGSGEGVLLGVLTGSLLWAAGIGAVWSALH